MKTNELNLATLTTALVPVLNKWGRERRTIILLVGHSGRWMLTDNFGRRAYKLCGLTSASCESPAGKVAARLLSDLN